MPEIKISPPSVLDEKYGIPWHAQEHCLTLCELHVSKATRDMLRDDPDSMMYAGGSAYAVVTQDVSRHCFGRHHRFCFMDGTDISDLPTDLRDCVMFAAVNGFNAIEFQPYDMEDCPLTPYLKTYD